MVGREAYATVLNPDTSSVENCGIFRNRNLIASPKCT